MSNLLVDEESLETLTYERSKLWSNFLKRCENMEDGEEINVSDIEEIYKNNDEESIADVEEAVEDVVDEAEEVHNTTAFMSKAELTLMICSGDNKEILDQTLPIVQEHVRKWKAAGLDRILNTFDEQKIEQHVGDWLRRHNSAYGDKTLQPLSQAKQCHRRFKANDHVFSPAASSDSETESMHSVDTARYIRASRKRTVSTATKCSSPMTTIKMYRTLPRMRDELRAKYSCNEYNEDQEHRHHMLALRHRRDQLHRCNRERERERDRGREREIIYHPTPRHYPYRVASSFHGQQRRKQLRKRRDSSPHFPSTSSSEDESAHSRCNCNACMRRVFSMSSHPYCGYRSYQSHSLYHHQRLEMGSSTSHSTFKHSVRHLRRQHSFEDDLRPRLLESECKCCNKDRLCSNVVHIANSSTEEWLVENRSSPDLVNLKAQTQTPTSSRIKTNSTLESKMAPAVEHIGVLAEETDEDTEEGVLENKINTDKEHLAKDKPKRKRLDKASKSIKNEMSEEPVKTKNERSTKSSKLKGNQLKGQKKKAVKLGKKGPAAEKKRKSTVASSTAGKARRKLKNEVKRTSEESENSDEDFKLAIALSKQTFLSDQKKSMQNADTKMEEDSDSSSKFPEQSTFNNNSVACNSTAVSIDTACAHSMKNLKMQPTNDVANTISLMQTVEISDSDGDCTIVTSTTGCEAAAAVAKPAGDVPQPPTDIKPTKKGYLLYRPADRSQNCNSGNFTLTEHTLVPIIGQNKARKFLKYYTGARSFDNRYSVYYRPTVKMANALSAGAKSVGYMSSSSSGSDSDIFDRLHRYGDVYLEKNNDSD
ncbi:hypothetical protein AWZ03_003473 [Drosophila navojoa]|uniref:Uncharacterized protein n=1 Tax=Drosophila navojoa TaxID=7232 RepID=A0A484BMG4_DRONA|nr:uncharacterized protein LOC108657874 [Drosophila navojoa]TDG49963.1 hypothetical protein AWZ03_003473 [Drosophila navojoa]